MEFKVLREKFSSRGGGMEIDLTPFGFEGEKMAVFQNYLGGGLLGSIGVNDTVRAYGTASLNEESAVKLDQIGEELKKRFYSIMNDGSLDGYESLQNRPLSAY